MVQSGYQNNFHQPVDYTLVNMLDMGASEENKMVIQMTKLFDDARERNGKLDNLDWLLLG